jgi:hypothetical protein
VRSVTGTQATDLARIVDETLDPRFPAAPGGVQPFVDLLESIHLSYQ